MSGFVVRELVATFVASIDNSSFEKLEHRIEGLKHALVGVAAGLVAHDLFEMGENAAKFEDARSVFVQAGGDLEKLRMQTRGLVSDFALVKSFNFAQQFGLGEHLGDFFKIANAASKKFGMDKEKALSQVLYGVALHSGSRLKTVGINVVGQKKRIEEEYATLHGLNAKSLTQAQVMEAYAQEAIKQGASMIKQVGDAGDLASDRFQRLHAQIKNAKTALGEFVDMALVPMLDVMVPVVVGLRDFFDVLRDPDGAAPDAVEKFGDLATSFRTIGIWVRATWRTIHGFVDSTMGKLVLALVAGGLAAKFLGGPLAKIGEIMRWQLGPIMQVTRALWAAKAAEIATGAGAAAMGVAFLALLALLFVIGEEIAAIFDPDVDGFFETWSGHWEQLGNMLNTDPSDSIWVKGMKGALQFLVAQIALLDRGLTKTQELLFGTAEEQEAKVAGQSTLDAYLALRAKARQRVAAEAEGRQKDRARSGLRDGEYGPTVRPAAVTETSTDFSLAHLNIPVAPITIAPAPTPVPGADRPNVVVNMTLAAPYDQPTLHQIVHGAVTDAIEQQSTDASAATRPGPRVVPRPAGEPGGGVLR